MVFARMFMERLLKFTYDLIDKQGSKINEKHSYYLAEFLANQYYGKESFDILKAIEAQYSMPYYEVMAFVVDSHSRFLGVRPTSYNNWNRKAKFSFIKGRIDEEDIHAIFDMLVNFFILLKQYELLLFTISITLSPTDICEIGELKEFYFSFTTAFLTSPCSAPQQPLQRY